MTIRTTPPTPQEFLDQHLVPGSPLVVTGGLSNWRDAPPWSFESLVEKVGAQRVPLYDSLFSLVGISTFRDYYDRFLGSTEESEPPYLRWFARQSDERLPWSDDAFEAVGASWHMPEWLPTDGYVFPVLPGPTDVTRQPFPAKGIFICGRNGMTSWHVDPWHSDAYLCQVIGHKRIVLYPPGTPAPTDGDALRAVIDDPSSLPAGWPAQPVLDVVLAPGDCIYIPQGHPHAAVALYPSLSITWNFVHSSHDEDHLQLLASGHDLEPALAYFSATTAATPRGGGRSPSITDRASADDNGHMSW
jgi:hypothetical protein